MVLDGAVAPRGLVVLNHSLRSPFSAEVSAAATLGARIARSSLVASAVARLASRAIVERRLRSTGSELDARGVELYTRLLRTRRHVGAALGMMAQWDLTRLEAGLSRLRLPVLLVAGERDPWFRPDALQSTAARLPRGSYRLMPATGHLSHEERPDEAAAVILEFAARAEGEA